MVSEADIISKYRVTQRGASYLLEYINETGETDMTSMPVLISHVQGFIVLLDYLRYPNFQLADVKEYFTILSVEKREKYKDKYLLGVMAAFGY